MFTATPTNHISFSSIGVVGKKSGNSLVQIWTRTGPYLGFENSSNGWELCFNKMIVLQQGVPTSVDLTCSTHTTAGSTRSFHVYSKNGLNFEKGTTTTSNALVKVQNGAILKDLFKQIKGDGLIAGSLR